jgi:hypothetical protein
MACSLLIILMHVFDHMIMKRDASQRACIVDVAAVRGGVCSTAKQIREVTCDINQLLKQLILYTLI